MSDGTALRPDQAGTAATRVMLSDLPLGAVGILQQVADEHAGAVLRSLGLTTGARLRVCRSGDPCIIQVRATRIGLSKLVAQAVSVTIPGSDGP